MAKKLKTEIKLKAKPKPKKEEPLVLPNMPHFRLRAVVELLHVSARHVKEEIKRGNLRAFKPGKELIFFQEDIEKWVKRKAV